MIHYSNNQELENIMKMTNHQALRVATNIVTSMVCRGISCTKSYIRDSGNIMEWYMDNGDIVEIHRVVSYRTGIPTPLYIMVKHLEESDSGDRYITLFEKKFDLELDNE